MYSIYGSYLNQMAVIQSSDKLFICHRRKRQRVPISTQRLAHQVMDPSRSRCIDRLNAQHLACHVCWKSFHSLNERGSEICLQKRCFSILVVETADRTGFEFFHDCRSPKCSIFLPQLSRSAQDFCGKTSRIGVIVSHALSPRRPLVNETF